jgi:hypothetical protein
LHNFFKKTLKGYFGLKVYLDLVRPFEILRMSFRNKFRESDSFAFGGERDLDSDDAGLILRKIPPENQREIDMVAGTLFNGSVSLF